MNKRNIKFTSFKVVLTSVLTTVVFYSCVPTREIRDENTALSDSYQEVALKDSTTTANMNWKDFFNDPNLTAIITTLI